MKRALLLVFVLLVAAVAFAQDAPKVEVFGGYSYQRASTGDLSSVLGDNLNTNGWDVALTTNFHKNFGVTADFAGHYGNKDLSFGSVAPAVTINAHSYSFMFGPQVGAQLGKVRPFAHALFGADRVSLGAEGQSLNDTGFAMAFGGGLDVKASKVVSIRVGQLDYVRTQHGLSSSALGVDIPSAGLNNLRFSTGIVLNLGGSEGKRK